MQSPIDTFIAPVCHEQIRILYQDEYLLMIEKPSGLLSLSGKHPLNKDSVHYRLTQNFPSATLVHRLDFGTSGIMLVALNKQVNAELTKQFQARTVEKRYIAFLNGWVEKDIGYIEAPIAKDKENFPLQKICYLEGKPARSFYRVLERTSNPDVTKVEFQPESGRTHQLRIHSRELGHEIVGCDLYASKKVGDMSHRLMLHASYIQFTHPLSQERVQGESKLAPFC
ncbi:MAG: RluA family pseudouridine synthase [Oleiphilus sp.]